MRQCSFDEVIVKAIFTTINARLSTVCHVGVAHRQARGVLLPEMTKWLTKCDWDVLDDPDQTLQAKINIVIRRAKHMGAPTLSEPSVGRLVGLISAVHFPAPQPFPSAESLYAMVCDVGDLTTRPPLSLLPDFTCALQGALSFSFLKVER